jgi:hypothetical protein
MDDIPLDSIELKKLQANCQRLYYRSLPSEKKRAMQDKQRIRARLKYQSNSEHAEKVDSIRKNATTERKLRR